MVQLIPPPQPRDLLQPLLACLPSPTPPPALLPLLSPILRQRVQLLSAGSSESWLRLLSWDTTRAAKLPAIVSRIDLEPHPVSGEIEVPDVDEIRYRRLDAETLHTGLDLREFGLLAIYLWCTGDETGWRLAELRASEDAEDGTEWFSSMDEANEASRTVCSRPAATNGNGVVNRNGSHTAYNQPAAQDDDDDDGSYWAAYDRTPGRTPARTPAKRSPAPMHNSSVQLPSTSELEYFARYAAEVQPALDAHDPDEESPEAGESTLNGDELTRTTARQPQAEPTETTNGYDSSLPPAHVNGNQGNAYPSLNHPRPLSPASSSRSGSVERLEQTAESHSQAEIGIKQHISTDIKSLFRLARCAGIQREEFERIVKTELEVLSMMDMDD